MTDKTTPAKPKTEAAKPKAGKAAPRKPEVTDLGNGIKRTDY